MKHWTLVKKQIRCHRRDVLSSSALFITNPAVLDISKGCKVDVQNLAKHKHSKQLRCLNTSEKCSNSIWSEASMSAFSIANNAKFLHADNENCDQTAPMRRLIWVFVGRTCQKIHFLSLRFILCYCVCYNASECAKHTYKHCFLHTFWPNIT